MNFHDESMQQPYFICVEKEGLYAFYHLEQCGEGSYYETYIADVNGDGKDEFISSFTADEKAFSFQVTVWSAQGLDAWAYSDNITLIDFEISLNDRHEAVVADAATGYEEVFSATEDFGLPAEFHTSGGKIAAAPGSFRFRLIDLDYDKSEELMVYQPFCATGTDGIETTIGFAYQALKYNADNKTFNIERSRFVPASAPPLDFAEERVFGYSPDRNLYRYEIEDADWNENEQDFPPQWIAAAKDEIVLKRNFFVLEDITFTRGWFCDFDRDKNEEAILLLHGIKDESTVPLDGDSHFVFVSSNGEAQYLTYGCDVSAEIPNGISRRMNAWLIRYSGFDHIRIHTGNMNAVRSSINFIYRVTDNTMEELIYSGWPCITAGQVFFENVDPWGVGSAYHFWDEISDCYATVGPVEVPPKTFFDIFDPEKIVWTDWQLERGKDKEALAIKYSQQNIDKLEVYGNCYYHIWLAEETPTDLKNVITWYRRADGYWELFHGPGPLLNSLTYGGTGRDYYVYDIDMNAAAQSAA